MDSFLSALLPEHRQYPAIMLDLPLDALSPLKVLGRVSALLCDGGKLFVRPGPHWTYPLVGPPARRSHYLQALAAHFGLVPESRGEPDGLVFVKSASARWSLTQPAADAYGDYRELFLKSFGHGIGPELWRWKYGGGRGRAIGAERDGQAVAHYGGTARKVLFFGEESWALQICDVMVDPAERAVMTKRGVFFQVASAFLDAYFGYDSDYRLAYGFPSYRHLRLAQKMGLYEEVDRIVELRWPAGGRARIHATASLLETRAERDRLIPQLWQSMRRDLKDAIAVVRDAEYIEYRYVARPERVYDFLLVRSRWSTRPLGLAVLYRDGPVCKLMDMVGPLAAIPELVAQARRQASAWGCEVLMAWAAESQLPRADWGDAARVLTDVCIPANIWSEGPDPERLRSRWWAMMGDTEFL